MPRQINPLGDIYARCSSANSEPLKFPTPQPRKPNPRNGLELTGALNLDQHLARPCGRSSRVHHSQVGSPKYSGFKRNHHVKPRSNTPSCEELDPRNLNMQMLQARFGNGWKVGPRKRTAGRTQCQSLVSVQPYHLRFMECLWPSLFVVRAKMSTMVPNFRAMDIQKVQCLKNSKHISQRLLGLSTEDPAPPLDTPEAVGGLKTRLFEGPKSIGSLWVVTKMPDPHKLTYITSSVYPRIGETLYGSLKMVDLKISLS